MNNLLDFDVIDRETPAVVAKGTRIFTTHLMWSTGIGHAMELSKLMALPPMSHVCSMGCGIGELEAFLHWHRPDLRFTLVNLSRVQLGMCPIGPAFTKVYADAEDSHLPAGHYDCVLFHTALVQMDRERALREAFRITKPGGKLAIWDVVRWAGSNDAWRERLAGEVPVLSTLVGEIHDAGYEMLRSMSPPVGTDSNHFLALLPEGDHWMVEEVSPRYIDAVKLETP